jgi:hypothetical protein
MSKLGCSVLFAAVLGVSLVGSAFAEEKTTANETVAPVVKTETVKKVAPCKKDKKVVNKKVVETKKVVEDVAKVDKKVEEVTVPATK